MHASDSRSLASHVRGRAKGLHIGIAVSTYHETITGAMRDRAVAAFLEAGGSRDDLAIVDAPGAFELIAVSTVLARRGDLDAVVAIGCIIAGETTHDQHIANAVSTGVAHAIVETGVPIAFGVLTCQSTEQARERAGLAGAGGKGNKGEEAMLAAIEVAIAVRAVRELSGVEC